MGSKDTGRERGGAERGREERREGERSGERERGEERRKGEGEEREEGGRPWLSDSSGTLQFSERLGWGQNKGPRRTGLTVWFRSAKNRKISATCFRQLKQHRQNIGVYVHLSYLATLRPYTLLSIHRHQQEKSTTLPVYIFQHPHPTKVISHPVCIVEHIVAAHMPRISNTITVGGPGCPHSEHLPLWRLSGCH